MLILEDFGRGFGIVEQFVDFLDLLSLHSFFTLNTAQQAGWSQQLYSIPERKQEIRATQYSHTWYLSFVHIVLCLFRMFFCCSLLTLYTDNQMNVFTWGWFWCQFLPDVWALPRWYWCPQSEHGSWWSTNHSLINETCTGEKSYILETENLRVTCFISCGVYNMVRIIMTLSSKSKGIPCGEVMSSVPLVNNRWIMLHLSKENCWVLCSFKDRVSLMLEPYLIKQFPLLEANTTIGAMVLSSARWR